MKTVTRSLLLSYIPISSDQLVELYCRRAEIVVGIYTEVTGKRIHSYISYLATYGRQHS